MLVGSENITNMLNSPVRKIQAKVELYSGSTLVDTYSYNDRLISVSIERVGDESKFFGYAICQKVNVHLLDLERELTITTDNSLKVYFGANDEYISSLPTFYVTQCRRSETTNELSITAYDALYDASNHKVSELELEAPYTINDFVASANAYINGSRNVVWKQNISVADLEYPDGANIEGTETIREMLDDAAEATQTICYINGNDDMIFTRLDISSDAVFTIDKSKYIDLDSGDNRRIQTVMHCTELGDNVSASIEAKGSVVYIRDNPFWDMRDDIGTLVDSALAAVGGLTINQFECEWRGNFLLELGDKINLVTKDNNTVSSYVLDDVIEYDGTFSQSTRWKYEASDTENADNPSSLGEVLKQTYAKVDKANRQIDLVASDNDTIKKNLSSLQINTESINASVQRIESNTEDALGVINDNISNLASRVEATMTADQVNLAIKTELEENGVSSVTTETGFTFNSEGLTIDKTGSQMKTTITDDGMTVYRDDEAVLTANNVGVDATNLRATTYLIIGLNSRFEDYDGGSRTGCFWIGS